MLVVGLHYNIAQLFLCVVLQAEMCNFIACTDALINKQNMIAGSVEELDIAAFEEVIDQELADAAAAEAAAAEAADGQAAAADEKVEEIEMDEEAEYEYAGPCEYATDERDADAMYPDL